MINQVHSHLPATKVRRLENFDVEEYRGLNRLGIGLDNAEIKQIMGAMDTVQSTASAPTITSLSQFLQNFLPGLVYVLTAPRVIDEIIGISIVGDWEDSEIVQGVIERTGKAAVYDDYTNIPLASYNNSFERRSIVRFEQGFRIGKLEQKQSVKMNFSADKAKREACALALDIVRNTIAFNGFNNGANRTYGFLNDPNLPAYVNVPVGASGQTTWSTKTFLEITRDLRMALAQLQNQSNGLIDPMRTEIVLVLPTSQMAYLTTTSDFGYSVQEWLEKNFPRVRIVSAPQLNGANGNLNVFYMFAARVEDGISNDDGRVFDQLVQTKFQLLGTQQMSKGYEEDYAMASAGVIFKRPYAAVRYSGI